MTCAHCLLLTAGKVIASVCALTGLIIIALLIGVVARNVAHSYDMVRSQERLLEKRRAEKAKLEEEEQRQAEAAETTKFYSERKSV